MNGRENPERTLKFHHFPFLRYGDQLRAELDSELRPTTIYQKRERDVRTFKADRWVRISQETLVGKAHKQRRLSHRGIACKSDRTLGQLSETSTTHRPSRLASDDELENIMPCYTSHGTVVRSDGNCRERRPELTPLAPRSAHTRSRGPPSVRVEHKPSTQAVGRITDMTVLSLSKRSHIIDAIHLTPQRLNFTVNPAVHPHLSPSDLTVT